MPEPALQLLDAASVSHTMTVPADPALEPDFLALPDAPAVCVFESGETPPRTILLATTASARDLVRRRFGAGADASPATSARPDLHALCAGGRVLAIAVGSSLEADAVYLRQARQRLPHLARVVAERWRAWFVHVDPSAEFPQWTKTNLNIGLVGKRSASTAIGVGTIPRGMILGPIPDKDAAGRLIESVIDVFDLCRYHHLLVQAPTATACAYKEMGRCPAPCDGSETLARYRERTADAAASLIRGVGPSIERAEAEMKAAASVEAFEKAAAIQKTIARMRTLDKPAFAHVRDLHAWRELLVLPAARKDLATVALFDRGELYRVGDIDPAKPDTAAQACLTAHALLDIVPKADPTSRLTLGTETIDTIALVSRWMFLSKTKRKGDALRAHAGRFVASELHAAATALTRSKKAAPEIDGQEIEGAQ